MVQKAMLSYCYHCMDLNAILNQKNKDGIAPLVEFEFNLIIYLNSPYRTYKTFIFIKSRIKGQVI